MARFSIAYLAKVYDVTDHEAHSGANFFLLYDLLHLIEVLVYPWLEKTVVKSPLLH